MYKVFYAPQSKKSIEMRQKLQGGLRYQYSDTADQQDTGDTDGGIQPVTRNMVFGCKIYKSQTVPLLQYPNANFYRYIIPYLC